MGRKRYYVIAVDLGATNTKIGLISDNKVLVRKMLPTAKLRSKDKMLSALTMAVKDMINLKKIDGIYSQVKGRIFGVGFGLPGPIDYAKGIVHYFPNIKGWKNVVFKQIMRKNTGLPVFIDNDANLMCLAESRVGAARGKKNVIGITLGTGVGGGILINGSLYRGSDFAAGEIGHIPLNVFGPKCNCGGLACLERYIGNKYIALRARKSFKRNISLEELSGLAREGNIKAIKIWEEAGRYLGVALSGVVNLFNPEVIVIGGGLSAAGEIIFDNVRRMIRERAMPVQAKAVKVVPASLGNDAGMIGAGILVREGLGIP